VLTGSFKRMDLRGIPDRTKNFQRQLNGRSRLGYAEPVLIRELVPSDLARLVELNNHNVPAVSPSDLDGMAALLEATDFTVAVVDEADPERVRGFALLFRAGADYASENYRWFAARSSDFFYVDRIVVADDAQNAGVGRALYAAIIDAARERGLTEVTCEVNVDPPNPGSMRFHGRLGFAEVGRQSTKNDTIVVAMLAAPVSTP
jgi:predicted GNAT superfamily acetyltransferase